MLLWALNPDNPYGYYRLLRVVCCVIFSFLTYKAVILKKGNWGWVMASLALVYNPLFPLHMTRNIWSIVNIITIILAGILILILAHGPNDKSG